MATDATPAEVTRLATDGTPHVASKLYAACWRACRALGYRRLISYILKSELGTSLKAAGWRVLYTTAARPKGWSAPSRPREVKAPTEAKTLWDGGLMNACLAHHYRIPSPHSTPDEVYDGTGLGTCKKCGHERRFNLNGKEPGWSQHKSAKKSPSA